MILPCCSAFTPYPGYYTEDELNGKILFNAVKSKRFLWRLKASERIERKLAIKDRIDRRKRLWMKN